jgi:uncharacterized OsmC-like protein
VALQLKDAGSVEVIASGEKRNGLGRPRVLTRCKGGKGQRRERGGDGNDNGQERGRRRSTRSDDRRDRAGHRDRAVHLQGKDRLEGRGTSSGQISSFTHAGQESAHASAHTLVGSEPAVLLGDDSGANAVELVLAALGFCYSVGFAYNAAARGIELEELSYEVEGDLDLRAFLGLGGGPRAGFTQIRVKGIVKARNADAATLEELCQYVQDTSPVRDILANATPVVTDLEVR